MPDQRDTSPEDRSIAQVMQGLVEALQTDICATLEAKEPTERFRSDPWVREAGGGGLTRVLEGGEVFEKAGVNTSAVHGTLPARMAAAFSVTETSFFATGLSLVIHPRSPYVPTVHANFRYFALGEDRTAPNDQWFGGGADLTPYYPYLEDAQHFHRVWKRVCEKHPDVADYAAFKEHCDAYFFLPHRQEARGVGGIFYDYLRDDPGAALAFSKDAGKAFLEAYLPILEKRQHQPYGERERAYQTYRRGRYAEFNLLFDRGTKFGIETQGRTESILMSLPPEVRWVYDWQPDPGSTEEQAQWYFQPRNWLELPRGD